MKRKLVGLMSLFFMGAMLLGACGDSSEESKSDVTQEEQDTTDNVDNSNDTNEEQDTEETNKEATAENEYRKNPDYVNTALIEQYHIKDEVVQSEFSDFLFQVDEEVVFTFDYNKTTGEFAEQFPEPYVVTINDATKDQWDTILEDQDFFGTMMSVTVEGKVMNSDGDVVLTFTGINPADEHVAYRDLKLVNAEINSDYSGSIFTASGMPLVSHILKEDANFNYLHPEDYLCKYMAKKLELNNYEDNSLPNNASAFVVDKSYMKSSDVEYELEMKSDKGSGTIQIVAYDDESDPYVEIITYLTELYE